MEAVVRTRLKLILENLVSLIEMGQDALRQLKSEPFDISDAQIISSKLKVAVERFVSETYNYFKVVENPCADEVYQYTQVQIKGEELVTELNFYTQKRIGHNNSSTNTKVDTLNVASKLPKMELAKFDGDVLKWHQFWDQFASNVDNRNINDVDKLLYLQSVLEGEAKRAIDGLDTTNTNYQIAVSTLKDRYGKPGTIIDAHYAALYRIKMTDKSISDCRRVYNEIERHLRVLSSLGEDVNHNHLRVMIMQNFSEEIIYELRIKMGAETDTIANIRNHLEHIISAREASNRMKDEIFQSERPSTSKAEGEKFTLEALHAGTEGHLKARLASRKPFLSHNHDRGRLQKRRMDDKYHADKRSSHNGNKNGDTRNRQYSGDTSAYNQRESDVKRKRPMCIFCGNGHFNDECNIVKTVQERKNKLIGRCYNCLSKGHRSAECRSHMKCRHCGKYGDHNRALCPSKESDKTNSLHVGHLINNKGLTILQTAVVLINKVGNTSQTHCRILLDCGSQRTYITKDLAKKLKLPELEMNNLSVFTFGADHPNEIESPVVNFEITTRTNNLKTLYANVVPHITNNVPTLPCNAMRHTHKNNVLDQIIMADDDSLGDRVDLLIGNDYYFALIKGEKLQMADNLFLVDSIFGWIWSGRCTEMITNERDKLSIITYFQSSIECNSFCEPDLPLKSDNLKRLWDLESIGITDSPRAERDDEAVKQFNNTIEFFDNRYHVKWPWIEYPPLLPSNFGLSLGRLKSLLRRLDDDTILSYDNIIKEQLDKDIIEIVPDTLSSVEHPVHYLPHHCVAQGDKLRLVYDASSKNKGNKSLNECLYRGPLLIENLTGLLIRFREHRVGVVADVEKAFLQIGLQDKDRDVTRFLWPKNFRDGLYSENLMHLRFRRVPFGVISSPFLLNATIRYHLNKSHDMVHRHIAEDLYVDNLITGAESINEAMNLYQTAKYAFNELSMNLREWNSNSDEFVKYIPSQYRSGERTHMKVLGLNWDLTNDKLSLKFDLRVKDVDQVNTKREVLRLVASIFDPCGFSVPLLLPIKLFLQNLWHQKIEWDTKLSEVALEELKAVIESLSYVNGISVPRCFNKLQETRNSTHHELHAFADASMQAYAAAVYLRTIGEGDTELRFVIGKSRLIGKTEQTDLQIPKLELLGVLIGSRLIETVLKSLRLKVEKQYLWTDSQIVKSWCNSDKLLPPFIAKRVEEIRRRDLEIRYVPSQLNPADVATRTKVSQEDVERWLKGPDFLYHDHNEWPVNLLETLHNHGPAHNLSVGQGPPETTRQNNTQSSNQCATIHQSDAMDIDLEAAPDSHGIKLRQIQAECFPKELEGRKTDLVRSLGIYKDKEGILRCGGRLENTDWPNNQKNPILLPRNHDFTFKLIDEIHRKNYHVGVSQTLSLIRRQYWICKGRAQVQKVLKQCQSCRKYAGGPFKLPPMASLPTERVTYSEAFTYVGVDYFGPLLVDVNGSSIKRWVALYTCLAVRAIHMEVVADLTAEECLLAMRRFISSRGVPKLITSDNALQFKLTADVLTSKYCITNSIRWKFIPELAPWFGGFYERLIGIVKNCLKRTLDKHLLSHTQLCTVIKEIEAVVNSRPLTVVGDELEHILTPTDFLRTGGPSIPESSDREFMEPATVTKINLIDGWKRGQRILQEYVQMFSNQYLNTLRERRTVHRQARVVVDKVPKIGDLVQVKGDSNRALWKVGRISALIKSSDDKIRVAKVTTSPNETLTRSISHLYPLEIPDSHDISQNLEQSKHPETETPVTCSDYAQTSDLDSRSPRNDQTQEPTQLDISNDRAQATHDDIDRTPMSNQSRHTQLRPKRLTAQKAIEKMKVWTAQLLGILKSDHLDLFV